MNRWLALLASTTLVVACLAATSTADAASLVSGSGSAFAADAVDQWISDLVSDGVPVSYTANGSAQGRSDFTNDVTDFGVSDVAYQGVDPTSGDADSPCRDVEDPSTCRAFRYAPTVATALAFPYQLAIGGKQVTNLRLSGNTLAKIFTNEITSWNDPQIASDNPNLALPDLAITPVVHAEGSAATLTFTSYLETTQPGVWQPFFGSAGHTLYFPRQGDQIAQNGGDEVATQIAAPGMNGAIGYDEVTYALSKALPVARVLNAGGYFVPPSADAVSVALLQATDDDSGLPDVTAAFTGVEPRAYPLPMVTSFLLPTGSDDPRMTTTKRQTLADFVRYAVCAGQREVGVYGYAPLPVNLVDDAFSGLTALHTADAGVSVSTGLTDCTNPTLTDGGDNLIANAPHPTSCDLQGGRIQCAADGTPMITRPSAPRLIHVTTGGGSAKVAWTAPLDPGGASPTYGVTSVPARGSCTVTKRTAICRDLKPHLIYEFRVTASNAAGAAGATSAPFMVEPTSVLINDGATYARSANVQLRLQWPIDATSALVSNTSDFAHPRRVHLARHVSWTLRVAKPIGAASTVYVKYVGPGAQTSAIYRDSIHVDTERPRVDTVAITSSPGGALVVHVVGHDDISGLASVQVTQHLSSPGSLHRYGHDVTLRHPDRGASVYVRLRDNAGNYSAWARTRV